MDTPTNRVKSGPKHPSAKRIGQVKKALKEAQAAVPKEAVLARLEKGQDLKAAVEQYPWLAEMDPNLTTEQKQAILQTDLTRAEVRKKVSETLYVTDKAAAPAQQAEIVERQINRFYDFKIGNKGLMGHVESPHGTAPSQKIRDWCKEENHKMASHEVHTNEISQQTPNWMVFNKTRLLTDVNSLKVGVKSSLRSEDAVYTKEDNLNALKAQRDLTAKMLMEQGNLGGDGKAKNPYLAIYLHGKVDTRGHDFELAAKEDGGKGQINPLLAFWIAEKLREKIGQKGLKNVKGEAPTVNVVTYKGAYSGTNALTQLRHGNGTFDFGGFGENFQALQLECGAHMRKTYQPEIAAILQDLCKDFSAEFKAAKDLEKLQKFKNAHAEKLAKEQVELFSTKNLDFNDKIPADEIAFNKALREVFEVDTDDIVKMGNNLLKVRRMVPADMKGGKSMMLNTKFKGTVGEKLVIEKVVAGKPVAAPAVDGAKKPGMVGAVPAVANVETGAGGRTIGTPIRKTGAESSGETKGEKGKFDGIAGLKKSPKVAEVGNVPTQPVAVAAEEPKKEEKKPGVFRRAFNWVSNGVKKVWDFVKSLFKPSPL